MKKEKSRPEFEDDGRVIADMSDVGRPNLLIPRLPNKKPSGPEKTAPSGDDFSREERKAGLLHLTCNVPIHIQCKCCRRMK